MTEPVFPWVRVTEGDATLFILPPLIPTQTLALMRVDESPAVATPGGLGRGGRRLDDNDLGPLRLKFHRRGGLFGKWFPNCGLNEAAARRELEGEAGLRAAGILTQETLAIRIQSATPRLVSLQRFFPDESTYADLAHAGNLTEAQQQAADALLQSIWRAGYMHHDANGGNLLWNAAAGRWRLIDLASLRPLSHPWPGAPVEMMRRRLQKPPRALR